MAGEVTDRQPDETMTQGKCACGLCQYGRIIGAVTIGPDGDRPCVDWSVQSNEWPPNIWPHPYCPHCASELYRVGALAGYAGPPQEALQRKLRVCAIWEGKVADFLYAHGFDMDKLLADAKREAEGVPTP